MRARRRGTPVDGTGAAVGANCIDSPVGDNLMDNIKSLNAATGLTYRAGSSTRVARHADKTTDDLASHKVRQDLFNGLCLNSCDSGRL